jgi:hypothetical protein
MILVPNCKTRTAGIAAGEKTLSADAVKDLKPEAAPASSRKSPDIIAANYRSIKVPLLRIANRVRIIPIRRPVSMFF